MAKKDELFAAAEVQEVEAGSQHSNLTGTLFTDGQGVAKHALDIYPVILTNKGSTVAYSGTATTTPASVPAVAGNIINQIALKRSPTGSQNLEISMDGGSTYFPITKADQLTWDVRGEITQVLLRTTASTITWNMLINFEEF